MYPETNYELLYLRKVCKIQDDFIKENISKNEYEQQLESERLKYIDYLQKTNRALAEQMAMELKNKELLSKIKGVKL